jgi:hypothetical protein
MVLAIAETVGQIGRAFCGYCAAKHEKFFGWRLHLVCTAEGIPVALEPVD